MATSRAATNAFDTFLSRAWADHATRSDAVARRLRLRTPPPQQPEHLSALVRLVVNLLGEHLGPDLSVGPDRQGVLLELDTAFDVALDGEVFAAAQFFCCACHFGASALPL